MTRSRHTLPLAGLIALCTLSPNEVSGQEAQHPPNAGSPGTTRDSLPFRRGQWGAEFAIDDGTVGVGVLRFRSARRAWLLDASAFAAWSDNESSLGGDRTGTDIFVRLRTGPRIYRAFRSGTAGYLGMGVLGGYGWAASDGNRRRLWDAGVFGELGAVYFVTPHLSLGARVGVSAVYQDARQRSATVDFVSRDSRLSVGGGPVQILGALYF